VHVYQRMICPGFVHRRCSMGRPHKPAPAGVVVRRDAG
jgi:hypothetical protein